MEKNSNTIKLFRNKRAAKYIVIDNKKFYIPNTETREALGYDENQFPEDERLLDQLSAGENVTDVIKARLIRLKENPAPVYVVFTSPKYEKRHVPDPDTLSAIRRSQDEVETLSKSEFDKIPLGENLRSVKKWNKNIKNMSSEKKRWCKRPEIIISIILGFFAIVIAFVSIPWLQNWIPFFKIKQDLPVITDSNNVTGSNGVNVANLSSVFDLIDKVNKFDTSIDKENFINEISGTEVGGTGYITNIKSGYNDIGYYIVIEDKEDYSAKYLILCSMNKDEGKVAISKGKGSFVQFKGLVEKGFDYVTLKDCTLLQ